MVFFIKNFNASQGDNFHEKNIFAYLVVIQGIGLLLEYVFYFPQLKCYMLKNCQTMCLHGQ